MKNTSMISILSEMDFSSILETKEIRYRVLVVDDNVAIHRDFRKVLGALSREPRRLDALTKAFFEGTPLPAEQGTSKQKLEIDFASQGQEAAEMAAKEFESDNPYLLAFVDMRMPPGWDGVQTIEALWKIDPRLQVVICTAYSDYSLQDITEHFGRTDRLLVLKKPFDPIEVQQLCESLRMKWVIERLSEERYERIVWQQDRLQQIIDNSNAGIGVKDHEGLYRMTNQQFCNMFGLKAEDVIGQNDETLFPDSAEALKEYDQKALEKNVIQEEHVDPRCSEDQTFITVRFPLQRADGKVNGLCVILNDLTHFKQLEAQLHQSQKMEALGRLAGGIAHDFNNMLTAILGFGQLAQRLTDKEDPRYESLDHIINTSKSASALTKQLLALSRQQVMTPRTVNFARILRETAKMLGRLIGPSITLEIDIRDASPTVFIDPIQLEQVLMNLILNARDAVETQQQPQIKVILFREAERIYLEVADNGSGIDPEVLEKMWDPFFTTKAVGRGTGFGLSTVRGILDQCNGKIDVKSSPGKGSRFILSFPASEECVEEEVSETAESPTNPSNLNILVVDDNDDVRMVIVNVLKYAGYSVTDTGSIADAIRLANKNPPDLLICDLLMPEMNGQELVVHLQEAGAVERALFITGFAGVDDPPIDHIPVLGKPFETSELLAAVTSALDPDPDNPGES